MASLEIIILAFTDLGIIVLAVIDLAMAVRHLAEVAACQVGRVPTAAD